MVSEVRNVEGEIRRVIDTRDVERVKSKLIKYLWGIIVSVGAAGTFIGMKTAEARADITSLQRVDTALFARVAPIPSLQRSTDSLSIAVRTLSEQVAELNDLLQSRPTRARRVVPIPAPGRDPLTNQPVTP